jgi:hypothetical protein
MSDIRLDDDQLRRLAHMIAAEAPHHCRFDEAESKVMHRFTQSLENGGWQKWESLLAFGGSLIQARKAGIVALTATLITGLAAVIWTGIVAMIARAKGGG